MEKPCTQSTWQQIDTFVKFDSPGIQTVKQFERRRFNQMFEFLVRNSSFFMCSPSIAVADENIHCGLSNFSADWFTNENAFTGNWGLEKKSLEVSVFMPGCYFG